MCNMQEQNKTSKNKAKVKAVKNQEKFIIKKNKISLDFSDPDIFHTHDDAEFIQQNFANDNFTTDFKLDF